MNRLSVNEDKIILADERFVFEFFSEAFEKLLLSGAFMRAPSFVRGKLGKRELYRRQHLRLLKVHCAD